ncbi:MAG: DUF4837 family protein [Flavobacteriales bacterium]|jgi:hypothetical protein|nr:DUF4837 family protein [Flavobacteriales bacterium]
MKYFFVIATFIFMTLSLNSCIDDGFSELDLKEQANGAPGRIVVVLDKPYWETNLAKAIKETLGKPVETLPQQEPLFDVLIVDNSSFDQALKTNHTVLIFEVNKARKSISLNFNDPTKDIWAKGQKVYKISGGNTVDITDQYMLYAPTLINELSASAITGLQEEYKKGYNKAIKEELEITMDLSMNVPNTMKVAENFNELIWMQQIRSKHSDGLNHEIQQGLLVYTYPFIDDSTFTLEYQLNKRDSVLKKYIHGEKEGTYMATERSPSFYPEYVEKEYNENYVFEMKGLWKMENSLMGGPFISVSQVDKEKNRVITVEGYIFAPKFQKQPYLRELEAMIYSLDF